MGVRADWLLRPKAETDLAAIWQHGANRWGVGQADRYTDGMFALFDLLGQFPEMARERAEFSPPVRIHPTGVHLVIYRTESHGVEIIRILHASQNLAAYLLET